jgi:hypothetical protein
MGILPNWVYRFEESKKLTEFELTHYQTIATPCPSEIRDYVIPNMI